MITKVEEEGAFTSTAPKLLRASHSNYLIAKHEGYHMLSPLRTRAPTFIKSKAKLSCEFQVNYEFNVN